MADEIRVKTVGGTEVHRIAGEADEVDGTLVIDADTADARREIQATRARISGTIDELEESILQKKRRLEARMDVLAPVREQPFRALAMLFGAGLVLGLLTGGGDEEEDDEEEREHHHRPRGRHHHHDEDEVVDDGSDLWEGRARRLIRIAREQEEEIESLRDTLQRRTRNATRDGADDDGLSTVDRLRAFLSDHLTGMATDSIQNFVRRVART